MKRYNHTLLSAVRRYVVELPQNWDLSTPALAYAYNKQPHLSTGLAPLDLVLNRTHPSCRLLASRLRKKLCPPIWREIACTRLLDTRLVIIQRSQERYKRNLDARLRWLRQRPKVGGHVWHRRYYAKYDVGV